MNQREAWREGWDAGHSAALNCQPGKEAREQAGCQCRGETELPVSLDLCRECIVAEAMEAEDNARQFSPFEFLAHDINETEDRAEGLWEAYDAGVFAGAKAGARERMRREKSHPVTGKA